MSIGAFGAGPALVLLPPRTPPLPMSDERGRGGVGVTVKAYKRIKSLEEMSDGLI